MFVLVRCFKALLSKGLGMGIIAGSLLVKVPQIVKIFNSKSGSGINLLSVLLDLSAITFHMAYSYVNGYTFSSWGDNTFLALQTAIIGMMVLWYEGAKVKSSLFGLLYMLMVFALCRVTPMNVLVMLESCTIPILLAGKLTQAWTNYSNSSTGQISAATAFLLLAGSLARIFTSIQETGDSMIILTFCVSSFVNGIIAAQVIYYWNSDITKHVHRDGYSRLKSKTQ